MKIDRILSILVVLLRKERVKAKELAEMFGVSVRTILRDVEAINLAGIPIVTYQGYNGGIGIAEGYRLDRSLLTADDMAAILSTLKGMDSSIHDIRYEILMEKLKNILPASHLEKLNLKANQMIIDLSPWGGNRLLKEKIGILKQAIEQYKEISFTYTDAEGRQTDRRGEPYSLVLKGQHWYLYAWCLMRQAYRLYKVSRIKDLAVCEQRFKPRADARPEQLFEGPWQKQDQLVELELIFDRELKSLVEEWGFEGAGELPDGRILVKGIFPENKWLYGFLLSFGPGLEVAGPPHIRSMIREAAEGILKKYH